VVAALAGTTAHELNQPLTSIMALLELIRRRTGEDDRNRRYIDTIYGQAERMATIVKKISQITKYETKEYVDSTRILDLDKSSPDTRPPPIFPLQSPDDDLDTNFDDDTTGRVNVDTYVTRSGVHRISDYEEDDVTALVQAVQNSHVQRLHAAKHKKHRPDTASTGHPRVEHHELEEEQTNVFDTPENSPPVKQPSQRQIEFTRSSYFDGSFGLGEYQAPGAQDNLEDHYQEMEIAGSYDGELADDEDAFLFADGMDVDYEVAGEYDITGPSRVANPKGSNRAESVPVAVDESAITRQLDLIDREPTARRRPTTGHGRDDGGGEHSSDADGSTDAENRDEQRAR